MMHARRTGRQNPTNMEVSIIEKRREYGDTSKVTSDACAIESIDPEA